MSLQKNIMSQSEGVKVLNAKGESFGDIVDVTYDNSDEQIEHLIVSTDHFFGKNNRYFAIPVCPELIEVTPGGEIQINASENDLQFAKGIPVEKCPKPDLQFGITIYELFHYNGPKHKSNRTTQNLHSLS